MINLLGMNIPTKMEVELDRAKRKIASLEMDVTAARESEKFWNRISTKEAANVDLLRKEIVVHKEEIGFWKRTQESMLDQNIKLRNDNNFLLRAVVVGDNPSITQTMRYGCGCSYHYFNGNTPDYFCPEHNRARVIPTIQQGQGGVLAPNILEDSDEYQGSAAQQKAEFDLWCRRYPPKRSCQ
jgi:hypothetical protein